MQYEKPTQQDFDRLNVLIELKKLTLNTRFLIGFLRNIKEDLSRFTLTQQSRKGTFPHELMQDTKTTKKCRQSPT